MSDEVEGAIAHLQKDADRLRNSVLHLQRSNRELQEARSAGDNDPEYKTAIEENIVVIAKYQAQIQKIEETIQEIRQGVIAPGSGGELEPTKVNVPKDTGAWM